MFKTMKLAVTTLILLFSFQLSAQDPHFTQMRTTGSYLNPALTGDNDKFSMNLNYRNQWPEVSGNFVTYLFGAEYGFSKGIQGVGIQVYNNEQTNGVSSTTSLSIPVSKSIKISDNYELKIGLQPVFRQRALEHSRLIFGNQIDPVLGFVGSTDPVNTIISNFDLNSGIVLDIYKGQFGFSANNMLQPNESFFGGESKLAIRYSTFGAYEFNIGAFTLEPMIQWLAQDEDSQVLIANTLAFHNVKLLSGVRIDDAYYFGLAYDFGPVQLAYSYDQNYNSLSELSGGSHEAALLLHIGKNRKDKFKTGL